MAKNRGVNSLLEYFKSSVDDEVVDIKEIYQRKTDKGGENLGKTVKSKMEKPMSNQKHKVTWITRETIKSQKPTKELLETMEKLVTTKIQGSKAKINITKNKITLEYPENRFLNIKEWELDPKINTMKIIYESGMEGVKGRKSPFETMYLQIKNRKLHLINRKPPMGLTEIKGEINKLKFHLNFEKEEATLKIGSKEIKGKIRYPTKTTPKEYYDAITKTKSGEQLIIRIHVNEGYTSLVYERETPEKTIRIVRRITGYREKGNTLKIQYKKGRKISTKTLYFNLTGKKHAGPGIINIDGKGKIKINQKWLSNELKGVETIYQKKNVLGNIIALKIFTELYNQGYKMVTEKIKNLIDASRNELKEMFNDEIPDGYAEFTDGVKGPIEIKSTMVPHRDMEFLLEDAVNQLLHGRSGRGGYLREIGDEGLAVAIKIDIRRGEVTDILLKLVRKEK